MTVQNFTSMSTSKGHPRSQTVAADLAGAYRRFADQRALLTPEKWMTFTELEALASRTLALLAGEGSTHGDRVVLYLENSAVLRILEHAILGGGLVRVALSPRLHAKEVAAIAADCGASAVCCAPDAVAALRTHLKEAGSSAKVLPFSDQGDGHTPASIGLLPEPVAHAWPEVKPTDLAMLMYSSGTTGRPKGAMVTHAGWSAQAAFALAELPEIGPGDVVLAAAPMSHFGGSIGLDCAMMGAATVPMAGFEPRSVLKAVSTFGVTVLPLVPILLRSLVDELSSPGSGPAPGLRAIPYGGSPTDVRTLVAAAEFFPGSLIQFYGLAEALAPISRLMPADHDSAARDFRNTATDSSPAKSRLESAGRVVDGVDVRLDDDGQIIVRGATVMPGYWDRDEVTKRVLDNDGWFSTGDLGSFDDAGYLRIRGRLNDVIISGGFNVHPAEVEKVLELLPCIQEAVVLGAPHERWGEGVNAAVVLAPEAAGEFSGPGGEARLLDAMVRFCRGQLAGYKKPLEVRIVPEIPRNAAGKVDRNVLRPLFAASETQAQGR